METTTKNKVGKSNPTFDLERRPEKSESSSDLYSNGILKGSFDFGNLPLQPKLKINTPGDRFEQEADRIAEKVVNMHSIDNLKENPTPAIGKKILPDEISSIGESSTQRKCSKCKEEEEETIHRKASIMQPVTTTPSFNSQLNSTRGRGNSMDATTQQYMSSRFGVDFSQVNIHNDDNAAKMSQSIKAKAFTIGKDIYFNENSYQPNSIEGRKLLAHELTHTLQQRQQVQRAPFDRRRWQSIPIDYDLISDPIERMEMMRADYAVYIWKDALERLAKGELVDEDLKNESLRDRLTGLKTVEITNLITKIKGFQQQRDQDVQNPAITDPKKKIPVNTNKIKEWLEVRKVISTPIPENATVKNQLFGGIESFVIDLNDIQITVKSDSHAASGNATTPTTNFTGNFQWLEVNGKIKDLKKDGVPFNPTKLEVEIVTSYKDSPDDPSGYGKGTTESDKWNQTTTLRVHEGQHGTDFINYLTNTPLPVTLKNGVNDQLTPSEFREILKYTEKITKETCETTDQSGFSQDDFLKTERGKRSGIISCRKP